jgi:hypothetical protein
VSAPNTAVSWVVGSNQTVTWAVAGTTANAVNAAFVDIFLSTDGGFTYPIQLATMVSNNGSSSIIVPNNIGTTNRIMVKGYNHIFFDISNTNFSITPSLGIADNSLANFTLFPNPNKGNFTVQFDSNSNNDIAITVHDMRGRLILNNIYNNTGLFSQNVQLDNIQAGVYLVTVQDGDRKVVKRIVIE